MQIFLVSRTARKMHPTTIPFPSIVLFLSLAVVAVIARHDSSLLFHSSHVDVLYKSVGLVLPKGDRSAAGPSK